MKRAVFLALLCLFPWNPLHAGDIERRVENLERENRDLRLKVDELEKGSKPVEKTRYPNLKFQGFADTGFRFEKGGGTRNSFGLGAIDLFIASALHERVHVLIENVLEFDTDNGVDLSVERLQIDFEVNDFLKITLGRFHVPISLWNITYHHGVWFQTTIGHPVMCVHEEEGGFLPNHVVGVLLAGAWNTEPLKLDYLFSVGNGRGRTTEEVQNLVDRNAFKSLNLMLRFSPRALEGFSVGLASWYDQIPSNPAPSAEQLAEGILARPAGMKELIAGGHLAYRNHKVEILGEASYVFHEDESNGGRFHNFGAYGLVAYQFPRLKPYYRFDILNFDEADTFYAPNAVDRTEHHVGLRWDIVSFAALKVEYTLNDQDGRPILHSGAANVSFHF